MSGTEILLPTSVYDPAATRRILGEEIEVATIETGDYLRIRLPDPNDANVPPEAKLRELLNQILRASIEAKLPSLRAEDE